MTRERRADPPRISRLCPGGAPEEGSSSSREGQGSPTVTNLFRGSTPPISPIPSPRPSRLRGTETSRPRRAPLAYPPGAAHAPSPHLGTTAAPRNSRGPRRRAVEMRGKRQGSGLNRREKRGREPGEQKEERREQRQRKEGGRGKRRRKEREGRRRGLRTAPACRAESPPAPQEGGPRNWGGDTQVEVAE